MATCLRAFVPAAIATAAALAACGSLQAPVPVQESFESATTFTRTYAATDVQTCEAARRTLLSQGYVISMAAPEQVRARKSFQPVPETHVEVEFNVVCTKDGYAGKRTIAFVNAVQERYALKKSNSSASLGVGAFGSVSLPFTGSEESLVKVASATISSADFYDRFFVLVERYLAGDPGQRIEPVSSALQPVQGDE
ncbi:MAG TPA: DUF2242 domain-containing protein [Caldimonas sp.]|nr:DUF2242 domain-containing protein [Caldimonas sp.]